VCRTNSRSTKHLMGTVLAVVIFMTPGLVTAHGFAGKRFFPATLTFDDPFAADELDILYNRTTDVPDEAGTADVNSVGIEYAKTITPSIALSVGTEYDWLKFSDGSDNHGFNNIEIGGKFLGYVDAETESVWSYGLNVELGGTGNHGVGEDFDVFSPTLFFGKGFGNLSSSALRPMAVTGAFAVDLPNRSNQPNSLSTALSFQYNVSYLSSFVKDVGLPRVLRNSLFLVEVPLSTCLNQGCGGDLSGTVNPGILLFNTMGQITVEAPIPINHRTGKSVGVLVQLHFYLDDIFPHSIGKPIFGD
jgi:hypothetical protein